MYKERNIRTYTRTYMNYDNCIHLGQGVLDFLDSVEDSEEKDSDFLIADPQEQFIKDLKSDDFFKHFF